MREVISGRQRSSAVISGHQGHQRSSEVIRGHQRSSEAIRGHLRSSDELEQRTRGVGYVVMKPIIERRSSTELFHSGACPY
jgi:hypothetical protein